MERQASAERLWRVRKHQQTVDAMMSERDGVVTLEYVLNGRRGIVHRWPSRAKAVKVATEKRKELERAGWATHW